MRDYAPQTAHSDFKRRGSESQFLKCSLFGGWDACDIMTVPIALFTAFQFAYYPYYIEYIMVLKSQKIGLLYKDAIYDMVIYHTGLWPDTDKQAFYIHVWHTHYQANIWTQLNEFISVSYDMKNKQFEINK